MILSLGYTCVKAQHRAFIENKGQWEEAFDYKLPLGKGGVFLEGHQVTFNLVRGIQPKRKEISQNDPHHFPPDSVIESHAYRMSFLNGNPSPDALPQKKRKEYLNFILGNNPDRWKGHVGLFEGVRYEDVYSGIDALYYFSEDENLKYDLIIKPGTDPSQINILYEGQDQLKLVYGNLMVYTAIENILESAPYAYQWVNGKKQEVICEYVLEGDTLSFDLGKYDSQRELIIDPTLIFSTYSGSATSNFGYTATFSADGSAYGGGIVFGQNAGYPTRLAFQSVKGDSKNDHVDIGISKYTADGTDLIYSTYLGGVGSEMPYSLLEAGNGDLIIMGNTGSADFPVDATSAYQKTMQGGTSYSKNSIFGYTNGLDIFMTRLRADGAVLIGSTYLGGSSNDGINVAMAFNYGDEFRGDIAEDMSGNIYAVSNTFSSDFPGVSNVHGGVQDAVVFSLNPDFSQLNWSKFLGGAQNDALFSIKLVHDSLLYMAGVTGSPNLIPAGVNAFQSSINIGPEGWAVGLSSNDGSVKYMTYNGTNARDANYMLDVDEAGNIYTFGQSLGNYPVKGENVFAEVGAHQFIQMFSADLSESIRSTVFGNPQSNVTNISPTALMIDFCNNVYISGWGGFSGTNTANMFVTPNAIKPTTDGRDFYLMVLDASWEKVNYATYFGENGGTGDHVDGGTSRFRKDGTIFQAVCASCANQTSGPGTNAFPTTPNAYSANNAARNSGTSGNCNMAVFKFAMETDITIADVDAQLDSACIPYLSKIQDLSYNSDIILVEFPGGNTDTLKPSGIEITTLGYQTIRFIAIDTTCGFSDTTSHVFFGDRELIDINFKYELDSCGFKSPVKFINQSQSEGEVLWDFGDGSFSQEAEPEHIYSVPGEYQVKLFITGNLCGNTDSLSKKIVIRESTPKNDFEIGYDPCESGLKASFIGQGSGFQIFKWYVNDSLVFGGDLNQLAVDFSTTGAYEIRLESEDTICDRYYTASDSVEISGATGDLPFTMPNVFTPNGDGSNDRIAVTQNYPVTLVNFQFQVFNRWGVKLYQANSADQYWDGFFDGKEVPQGVYYYLLSYTDDCGQGQEIKGFFHIFR